VSDVRIIPDADTKTFKENNILIDPNTKNFKVSELINPNIKTAANYTSKCIETNVADLLFHELGEVIFQEHKYGQGKALDYNNKARSILKLKKRNYDEHHNFLPK